VRRLYLDELPVQGEGPPGLGILQLAVCAGTDTTKLTSRLLERARREPNSERSRIIVELTEEVLIRRFSELPREEIRRMFKLDDLRKTRVWQEAHEEGIEKGIEKGRQEGIEKGRAIEKRRLVERLQARGQTLKEIAQLLGISVSEVRRLASR
jgi:predicted transposase/invertase (TIGR01784 family)